MILLRIQIYCVFLIITKRTLQELADFVDGLIHIVESGAP